jgi:hypothetical protein
MGPARVRLIFRPGVTHNSPVRDIVQPPHGRHKKVALSPPYNLNDVIYKADCMEFCFSLSSTCIHLTFLLKQLNVNDVTQVAGVCFCLFENFNLESVRTVSITLTSNSLYVKSYAICLGKWVTAALNKYHMQNAGGRISCQ